MKKHSAAIVLFFLCLFCFSLTVFGQESEDSRVKSRDIVQAKIGIRVTSKDAIRRAKSKDSVKAGDRLQLYIQPGFQDAMIYVLYHNQQQIVPLYQQQPANTPLILPSPEGSYTVDGESPQEKLTIICSPEPISELEDFLQAQTQEQIQASTTWKEVEAALLEQSTIDLSEDISKPWGIAGAVRAVDPFLMELPIFSGKDFLIKKYEFLVEE